MNAERPFPSSGEETRDQLMRATYDALCEHGYTDLTMQRIGDEFPKSKSLVYRHYDGKDELLVEFLGYMLEGFETGLEGREPDDPAECLANVLDHVLAPTERPERARFTRALTALRGRAAHDRPFREQFTRGDLAFRDHLAGIVRDGVEAGTFEDADPERVADHVVTVVLGADLRRVTTDDAADVAAIRAELDAYLRARLGPDAA